MNCVDLMLMFVMSEPITIFMLLDAICTLKDLDLGSKTSFMQVWTDDCLLKRENLA